MDKEQYLQTQMSIINIGKMVGAIDVEQFLKKISTAEAIAPTMDPALYRKAQENLNGIKRLAESLLEVQRRHRDLIAAVFNTHAMKLDGVKTNED